MEPALVNEATRRLLCETGPVLLGELLTVVEQHRRLSTNGSSNSSNSNSNSANAFLEPLLSLLSSTNLQERNGSASTPSSSSAGAGVVVSTAERGLEVMAEGLSKLLLGNYPEYTLSLLKEANRPSSTCGHSFAKGETTYHCRDCANDPTCVLCANCFKNGPHKKHNYKMSYSHGGGCCDCGDDEAWRALSCCDVHAKARQMAQQLEEANYNPMDALPQDVKERAVEMFDVLIGFLIEVFSLTESSALSTLKCTPSNLAHCRWIASSSLASDPSNAVATTMPPPTTADADAQLSSSFLGIFRRRARASSNSNSPLPSSPSTPTPASTAPPHPEAQFVVALYNDEIHNFGQVSARLHSTFHISPQEAQHVAQVVDAQGRAIVFVGSLQECVIIRGKLEALDNLIRDVPLNVRIHPVALVKLQDISLMVMGFLCSMCKSCNGFERIVCDALCKPSLCAHLTFLADMDAATTPLDCLFRWDHELWKSARAAVHNLMMNSILMEKQSKQEFAKAMIKSYHYIQQGFLRDSHALSDSIIGLSVQIFTVPSIVKCLVKEHRAMEVLMSVLVQTFRPYVRSSTVVDPVVGAATGYALDCDDDFMKMRRYFHILFDLRYVLRHDFDVGDSVPAILEQFLQFLHFLQEMDRTRRQVGEHVEHESEAWVNAFTLYLYTMPILPLMAKCLCSTSLDALKFASSETVSSLLKDHAALTIESTNKDYELGAFSCLNYDVASRPVSLHIPVHRFLAILFESVHQYGIHLRDLLKNVPNGLFLHIMEHPLRIFVFAAQARAGMWVRNGMSIQNQLFNYFGVTFREHTFDKDVSLVQALLVLTLTRSSAAAPATATAGSNAASNSLLLMLIHRFGLDNWFAADPFQVPLPHPSARIEAELDDARKVQLILVEELLQLIICLVSETWRSGVGKVEVEDVIRREVIHRLCISSSPYSELTQSISKQFVDHPSFESIVKDVATFKQPEKVNESGVYELKESCYPWYTTHFMHYTRRDREQAEKNKAKRDKRRTNASGDDFVPPPRPPVLTVAYAGLEALMLSKVYVTLISRVLCRALSESFSQFNEMILQQALHLTLVGLQMHDASPASATSTAFSSSSFGAPNAFIAFVCEHEKSAASLASRAPQQVLSASPTATSFPVVQSLVRLYSSPSGKEYRPLIKFLLQWFFQSPSVTPEVRAALVASKLFEVAPAAATAGSGAAPSSEQDPEKQRKLLAQLRKEKIMSQFSNMQKQFKDQNMELYREASSGDSTSLSRSASAPSSALEQPSSPANTFPFVSASGPSSGQSPHPVSPLTISAASATAASGSTPLGAAALSASPSASSTALDALRPSASSASTSNAVVFSSNLDEESKVHTCLLCQEECLVSNDAERPMGLLAYLQPSAVLPSLSRKHAVNAGHNFHAAPTVAASSLKDYDDAVSAKLGSNTSLLLANSPRSVSNGSRDSLLMSFASATASMRGPHSRPGADADVAVDDSFALFQDSLRDHPTMMDYGQLTRASQAGFERKPASLASSADTYEAAEMHRVASDIRFMFRDIDTQPGIHVSSCGHAMHVECWNRFLEGQNQRQRLMAMHRVEDLSKREFLCPLCKTLGNTLIPLVSLNQLYAPEHDYQDKYDESALAAAPAVVGKDSESDDDQYETTDDDADDNGSEMEGEYSDNDMDSTEATPDTEHHRRRARGANGVATTTLSPSPTNSAHSSELPSRKKQRQGGDGRLRSSNSLSFDYDLSDVEDSLQESSESSQGHEEAARAKSLTASPALASPSASSLSIPIPMSGALSSGANMHRPLASSPLKSYAPFSKSPLSLRMSSTLSEREKQAKLQSEKLAREDAMFLQWYTAVAESALNIASFSSNVVVASSVDEDQQYGPSDSESAEPSSTSFVSPPVSRISSVTEYLSANIRSTLLPKLRALTQRASDSLRGASGTRRPTAFGSSAAAAGLASSSSSSSGGGDAFFQSHSAASSDSNDIRKKLMDRILFHQLNMSTDLVTELSSFVAAVHSMDSALLTALGEPPTILSPSAWSALAYTLASAELNSRILNDANGKGVLANVSERHMRFLRALVSALVAQGLLRTGRTQVLSEFFLSVLFGRDYPSGVPLSPLPPTMLPQPSAASSMSSAPSESKRHTSVVEDQVITASLHSPLFLDPFHTLVWSQFALSPHLSATTGTIRRLYFMIRILFTLAVVKSFMTVIAFKGSVPHALLSAAQPDDESAFDLFTAMRAELDGKHTSDDEKAEAVGDGDDGDDGDDDDDDDDDDDEMDENTSALMAFFSEVYKLVESEYSSDKLRKRMASKRFPFMLAEFVQGSTSAFLRRALIFSIAIDNNVSVNPNVVSSNSSTNTPSGGLFASKFDQLAQQLSLPSFSRLFDFSKESGQSLKHLAAVWVGSGLSYLQSHAQYPRSGKRKASVRRLPAKRDDDDGNDYSDAFADTSAEMQEATDDMRVEVYFEAPSSFGLDREDSSELSSRLQFLASFLPPVPSSSKPFALVPLPLDYTDLFDEAVSVVCPSCNTVPVSPALCLLCGKYVCSQAKCCQLRSSEGEAHRHAMSCGSGMGLFILIKKCVVVLMHGEKGTFFASPYLDAHGEADIGLRRGHPLFLNKHRYEQLNKVWLNHHVITEIVRLFETTPGANWSWTVL